MAIRVDTARVEGVTNSVFDRIVNADEGTIIGPIRYDRGYIVLVHDGVEPARSKTFEEAKTELTSVLQERLESAMIARLRRTYNVQEFPDRLIHAFTSN
jgi:peptidyl-prolyl cis-trans isomerase SurA